MHTFKEFRRQAKEARVLGNETRMKILMLLFSHAYCVRELAEILRIRAVNVTKHLRVLRLVGFVDGRRESQKVYFFLTDRARRSLILKRIIQNGVLGK